MTNIDFDPVVVFNAVVVALDRGDWTAAASLCDPMTLSVFQREFVTRLEHTLPVLTVERLLKMSPDIPREVAEYQVALQNRFSEPARLLRDELPGVNSVDALKAMSSLQVFAAWLEGTSHEHQVERASRYTHLAPEVLEAALRQRPKRTFTVLGTITENDRYAHVAYRQELIMPSTTDTEAGSSVVPAVLDPEEDVLFDRARIPPELATLRRQPDGSWRMVADYSFLGRNKAVFAFGYNDEADDKPS